MAHLPDASKYTAAVEQRPESLRFERRLCRRNLSHRTKREGWERGVYEVMWLLCKQTHNAQTCPLKRDLYREIRTLNERIFPLSRVANSYLQHHQGSKSLVKFLTEGP